MRLPSNYLHFAIIDQRFEPNVILSKRSITFNYPSNLYNDSSPYLVSIPPGKYFIQCWGSKSFKGWAEPGYGGYAAGTLTINSTLVLYIYLGSYSYTTNVNFTAYNGGGIGAIGGGGASDVRLIPGPWDDFSSLKSRIMFPFEGFAKYTPSIGSLSSSYLDAYNLSFRIISINLFRFCKLLNL